MQNHVSVNNKVLSPLYIPYSYQGICNRDDLDKLHTLVEYLAYKNYPISISDILSKSTFYENIRTKIINHSKDNIAYAELHRELGLGEDVRKAVEKVLNSVATEKDLQEVQKFQICQAKAYIRYPNISASYASKITISTTCAFDYSIPEELLYKFHSELEIEVYAKARDAHKSEETLKAIEDFNYWQALAYKEGYDLHCAKKIDDVTSFYKIHEICSIHEEYFLNDMPIYRGTNISWGELYLANKL